MTLARTIVLETAAVLREKANEAHEEGNDDGAGAYLQALSLLRDVATAHGVRVYI